MSLSITNLRIDEGCVEVVRTLPVCSDSSWTFWQNDKQDPFCCLPNQFGYQTVPEPGSFVGPGSRCADPGTPVAASLLAKSVCTFSPLHYLRSKRQLMYIKPK